MMGPTNQLIIQAANAIMQVISAVGMVIFVFAVTTLAGRVLEQVNILPHLRTVPTTRRVTTFLQLAISLAGIVMLFLLIQ